MINGITFSEQLMTSDDFAHFMYTFLNHASGITKGCEVSHADGIVYVQKGYFMQTGRMVRVVGVEEIPSPEVVSGQLYCKVVFEIDLSKENTEEEFNQGYFVTLTGAAAYPEVSQEDLDDGGTLFQMPWCQYIKTTEGITEFEDIREVIDVASVWGLYEDLTEHTANKSNPHGVTAEEVGARPNTWMPTASDVGAVAQAPMLYASILGTALKVGDGVHHYMLCGDSYSKYADVPNNLYWYTNATIYKRTNSNIIVVLHGYNEYNPRQINRYNGTSWSGWTTEFLPLTGGTLSGPLGLYSNYGKIHADKWATTLQSIDDDSTYYALLLGRPKSFAPHKGLQLRTWYSNDNYTDFLIYGTHNITAGTSDITAGTSELANGCYYDVYE